MLLPDADSRGHQGVVNLLTSAPNRKPVYRETRMSQNGRWPAAARYGHAGTARPARVWHQR